jgi:hypothetical protein
MTAESTVNPMPHPPQRVAGVLLLAWLVPGAGFLVSGLWRRGLTLFIVLNLTFAIGLAVHGGVVWPVWRWSDDGFNIVSNLSFIIELGAGLPSLVSLWADPQGWGDALSFLAADPSHPLYDLSSFYLLIAGAMNYFVVCNTYDRLFAGRLETAESRETD